MTQDLTLTCELTLMTQDLTLTCELTPSSSAFFMSRLTADALLANIRGHFRVGTVTGKDGTLTTMSVLVFEQTNFYLFKAGLSRFMLLLTKA